METTNTQATTHRIYSTNTANPSKSGWITVPGDKPQAVEAVPAKRGRAPQLDTPEKVLEAFKVWARSTGLQVWQWSKDKELFCAFSDVITAQSERDKAQKAFRDFCKQNGFTSQVRAASFDKHTYRVNGQIVERDASNANGKPIVSGTFNPRRAYGLDTAFMPHSERDALTENETYAAFMALRADVARCDMALREARTVRADVVQAIKDGHAQTCRLAALERQAAKCFLRRASINKARLVWASDVSTRTEIFRTDMAYHAIIQARDTVKLAQLREKAVSLGYSCTAIDRVQDVENEHIINGNKGYSEHFSDKPRSVLVTHFFTVQNLFFNDFAFAVESGNIIEIQQVLGDVPNISSNDVKISFAKLQGNLRCEPFVPLPCHDAPQEMATNAYYLPRGRDAYGKSSGKLTVSKDALKPSLLQQCEQQIAQELKIDVRGAMRGLLNEAQHILSAKRLNEDATLRAARYELQAAKREALRVKRDAALNGDALTFECLKAMYSTIASKHKAVATATLDEEQLTNETRSTLYTKEYKKRKLQTESMTNAQAIEAFNEAERERVKQWRAKRKAQQTNLTLHAAQ